MATSDFLDSIAPYETTPDGPYLLGKYSTLAEEYLHGMAIEEWATDSFGDVEAPTGYVWILHNTVRDLPEATAAFGPAPVDSDGNVRIVGWFLIREDSNGFVSVAAYPDTTAGKLEAHDLYGSLYVQYVRWTESDQDGEA